MSKVKITFSDEREIDYSQLKVPVYVTYKQGNGLYQLVMNTNDKLILIADNGYVQAAGEWDSFEDYFKKNPNEEIVDVEILVKRR